MSNRPKLSIIAGPNGSGKSTLAEFLKSNKSITNFLNADTIAVGLGNSPMSEIDSGRLLLKKISDLLDRKEDIAFETTLSGRAWIKLIKEARSSGYLIELYFIYVDSVEIAFNRVSKRVQEGGHSIPRETVFRRFPRSIRNFKTVYRQISDKWWLFNNSSDSAIMIASKTNGDAVVMERNTFNDFEKL